MFCGSCGSPVREGLKFCTSCGAPQDAACPSCGQPLGPGDTFCGHCGHSVGAPAVEQPRSTAERRLVSVLFADLVGFTSHSEGKDPEEVRNLLSAYFDRAREVIGLYGGVVEKFIGDAAMAVWGTPTAREDDTERAVRTALELVDAVAALGEQMGIPLQARAGVYTGEAAVTIGAEGQGMVAGDMVNAASRLQAIADPGTVLVDRSTYLGAREAVAFEAFGTLELKGRQDAVETWRPLRVVAGRRGFRSQDSLEPPFTGREEELRSIKDLMHATQREGKARLASVIGIPGIGKSRLVWELFKYIDGLSDTFLWHEGRSPAYGEGVAFWALVEMVRMRAGIAETDDDETARAKLGSCLDEYFLDPDERAWLKPPLLQLLGLDAGAKVQEQKLFAAWRTFFEGLAKDDPVVMVFEDLHWADPGLIDFVEHVMEWSRNSPIFILTLARPELRDKRPTWGAGARSFSSIHLDPLSDDEMTLLLKGVADLPPVAGTDIVERAEGVPLYAVEMIRMLIDRGDLVPAEGGYRWAGTEEHIEVPDSLHSLIASRLDALPLEDRLVVQDASVLGKTFTLPSLAAVTGQNEDALEPRLQDLTRREVLVLDDDPRSPERGQYGFVQSLIREIAYQTLANSDRRDKHLRAAQHFAGLGESDLADVIATHYVEAYLNSPKDGTSEELATAARTALVEAAQRARSLGSSQQASVLIEKALHITPEGQERGRLLRMAGRALADAGEIDLSIERLEAAIEILREGDDRSSLARARAQLGSSYFLLSRVNEAMEMLEAAVAELEDPARDPNAGPLYAELARMYTFAGEQEKAARNSELAMVPAERSGDLVTVSDTLITRGVIALLAGRVHEANALIEGGAKIAEENDLLMPQVRALTNLAANQHEIHPALAVETCEKGLALSRRYGLAHGSAYIMSNYVVVLCEMGRFERARGTLAEALENEVPENLHYLLWPELMRVAIFSGDLESAAGHLEKLEEVVSSSSSLQDHAAAADAAGLLALARGDYGEVSRQCERGAQVGVHTAPGVLTNLIHAGAWAKDARMLDRAKALADEVPASTRLWRARLANLQAARIGLNGSRADGIKRYEEAIAMWDELEIPLQSALSRMGFALVIGGAEAAEASDAAIAFFEDAGTTAFVERLRAAR